MRTNGELKTQRINTEELKPGMVIVCVTKQNGPIKIKKSGLVTSQDMVLGLVEMGIQQVEIDPNQTVEIDEAPKPRVKKSATRRMLESNTKTSTRIDDNLSAQFHRSLFLPSVQDIPSAWQFYTKRYLLAALIAIGGFGLGWTFSEYKTVLALFQAEGQKVVDIQQEQNQSSHVVDKPQQQQTSKEVSQRIDGTIESTPTGREVPLQQPDEMANLQVTEPTVEAMPEIADKTVDEELPAPQISEELLKRFNKAISDVSDEPGSRPENGVVPDEDVPRVDQLPAWVMTELPSMSFSAHMYASETMERWVRVNGTRMIEGDRIDDKVQIVRIAPQHVILNYAGHEFSMAALTDW